MQKLLLTVDKMSTFVGKVFSWLIVSLTFLITWEVFSRYALDAPHDWAFDGMIQMYGTLFFVFFLPGMTALCWAGYLYAGESWAIMEHSGITANGPPVYHFKTIIPLAGGFMLIQGIVEIIRCIRCLKEGKWPSRIEDVEEVDVEKLKAQMNVKDEDIVKLDEFLTAKKGSDK
jgi:TRAP-type mannitol/chloroaromatic compound transport system permease small subunit